MLKKYKLWLVLIATLVCLVLSIGIGYLFFPNIITHKSSALVYVEGDLSINYMDGDEINTNEEEKILTFSITNTSNTTYYYNLVLENVNQNNATFELTSTRKGFQNITRKLGSNTSRYATAIKIDGGESHSYKWTLKNEAKEEITGKLVVELEPDMNNFANIILKNNIVNTSSKTTPAQDAATEEEGLIESTDEEGTSYYFRGAVENNYVNFAGMTWRIVKINGDKTVKLILENVINENTQFYNGDYSLDFATSGIYEALTEWYQANLNDYDEYIATTKFCTDSSQESDGSYAILTRIYTDHEPIFHCLGKNSTLKIGLLTADEMALAGASENMENTSFYLHSDNISGGWWSMSPSKEDETYSFIEISANGKLNKGTSGKLFRGSRPVINLTKRTTVSGTGTKLDPYVVNTL